MVAAWNDADWITSELERLAARADRHGLGQVQQAYRAVLLARAAEIRWPGIAGHELGSGAAPACA